VAENEARALNKEAREHCASVCDWVTKELFDVLLADEDGHIDFLETQLSLHDRVGPQNYAQRNATRMNETE
jgi:bacterioferritin